MKRMIVCAFAILLAFTTAANARAQTAEAIWLTASTVAYKTGETVLVTINANSATPIQGFTFQMSYDPSCLRPVNASSPIPGMNGLPLPQLTGQVDGSYASTMPQIINGVLAEVRFTALKGCQTGLTLESAALAIRNPEGFAAPLPGILIGEKSVALNIDKELVASQSSQPESGAILPLDPPEDVGGGITGWIIGIGMLIVLLFVGVGFGAYKFFGIGTAYEAPTSKPSSGVGVRKAALHIRHGPQAGKSFALNKLPCLIGRDPQNDICINDPYVISQHAQIYSERNGYYLRDLGGRTFVNGHPVKSTTVILHPGDVVRLGKSALFVFG